MSLPGPGWRWAPSRCLGAAPERCRRGETRGSILPPEVCRRPAPNGGGGRKRQVPRPPSQGLCRDGDGGGPRGLCCVQDGGERHEGATGRLPLLSCQSALTPELPCGPWYVQRPGRTGSSCGEHMKQFFAQGLVHTSHGHAQVPRGGWSSGPPLKGEKARSVGLGNSSSPRK